MFQIILLCMCLRSSLAIVGGGEIDITQAPYQVYLTMDAGGICGGVIISAGTILTAASCISSRAVPVTFVHARAGSTLAGSGGVVVQGKGYVFHPKYSKTNHNFDVALIYTLEQFSFGPTIQPIAISTDRMCANADVEASGWGATSAGALSSTLRSVRFQIASVKLCQQIYGSYLGDGMFCAGTTAGGNGTCAGDGGGPVVMNGKLIGLTSQGKGCGVPSVPSIYSHVPAARDWIVQNTH